jgi:hypothetical protein
MPFWEGRRTGRQKEGLPGFPPRPGQGEAAIGQGLHRQTLEVDNPASVFIVKANQTARGIKSSATSGATSRQSTLAVHERSIWSESFSGK